MQARRRTNNKRPKTRRPHDNGGFPLRGDAGNVLPRSVDLIAPDRMTVKLPFNYTSVISIAPSSIAAGIRLQPSGAFDVDPALGSIATVGFAEWAAFYDHYRVHASTISVRFANTSTQPLMCVIVPLNADPGALPSSLVIDTWQQQPYNKHKLLASAGGPPVNLFQRMTTAKIFGDPMVLVDENFQSLTTTVPVNNWYWGIGVLTPLTISGSIDTVIQVTITMDVEFFSRKRKSYLSMPINVKELMKAERSK